MVRMRGWTGVWNFFGARRVVGCALADAGLDGFFKACLGRGGGCWYTGRVRGGMWTEVLNAPCETEKGLRGSEACAQSIGSQGRGFRQAHVATLPCACTHVPFPSQVPRRSVCSCLRRLGVKVGLSQTLRHVLRRAIVSDSRTLGPRHTHVGKAGGLGHIKLVGKETSMLYVTPRARNGQQAKVAAKGVCGAKTRASRK